MEGGKSVTHGQNDDKVYAYKNNANTSNNIFSKVSCQQRTVCIITA